MSRSQKVNESETMTTASAYLYKEQAECVQQVHQYLVEHLDSRVTQAELAQRYHISLTSLKGAFKQVYGLPINTYHGPQLPPGCRGTGSRYRASPE